MSYSFHATGRPSTVKKEIAAQFESFLPGLEGFPHEHASAALTKEIVAGQLNFLIDRGDDKIVRVVGFGSTYVGDIPKFHGTSSSLSVETLGDYPTAEMLADWGETKHTQLPESKDV